MERQEKRIAVAPFNEGGDIFLLVDGSNAIDSQWVLDWPSNLASGRYNEGRLSLACFVVIHDAAASSTGSGLF
jgi:hypothetical protein